MTSWNVLNTGKPDATDTADLDIISARIDNCEKGLSGVQTLSNVQINGGAIDGVPIGITTPTDANFTDVDIDNININGNTISSTDTNGNIILTPNGTGKTIITKLDSTPIGANTASTGAFTTLTCTSIATDSKEAIKMDIISATGNAEAGLNIAHTHSSNVRGITIPFCNDQPGYLITVNYIDLTNVNITSAYNGSATYWFIVFYV